MAWQYVGGTTGVGTSTGYTISLNGTLTGGIASSPATGDLVVVFTGFGNTAASVPAVSGNSSGAYIGIGTAINANDTWDTEAQPFYDIMGATPDTTLTITRTTNTAYGGATVVQVWRGVDTANPFIGVTQTSGTNGCVINPPAYDPAVANALIFAGGSGTMAATSNAYTGFTGMSNFLTVKGDGSTSDCATAMATYNYAGASYDPPAISGGTTSTSSSWAGFTFAFRMYVPPTQSLTPSTFTESTETFYSPTVTAGAVNLSPNLHTNDSVLYAPIISTTGGAQSLTATLFSNVTTYYSPTVVPGSISLSPSLYNNTQTFYATSVVTGTVHLVPTRLDNTSAFFSPSVSAGAATLLPTRLENANSFYGATVSVDGVTLLPPRIENTQSFGSAVVTATYDLQTSLYENGQTFYEVAIYQPGEAQSITPDLYVESNQFFVDTITYHVRPMEWVEPGWVQPGWVEVPYFNTNQFFASVVVGGGEVTETLTYAEIQMLTDIWRRLGLDPNHPLIQTKTTIDCGLILNVSGDNVVVVERQGVTTDFVSSHTTIPDLWKRFGLDATNPLSVSSTEISAGTVSQTISGTNPNITITRQ